MFKCYSTIKCLFGLSFTPITKSPILLFSIELIEIIVRPPVHRQQPIFSPAMWFVDGNTSITCISLSLFQPLFNEGAAREKNLQCNKHLAYKKSFSPRFTVEKKLQSTR